MEEPSSIIQIESRLPPIGLMSFAEMLGEVASSAESKSSLDGMERQVEEVKCPSLERNLDRIVFGVDMVPILYKSSTVQYSRASQHSLIC